MIFRLLPNVVNSRAFIESVSVTRFAECPAQAEHLFETRCGREAFIEPQPLRRNVRFLKFHFSLLRVLWRGSGLPDTSGSYERASRTSALHSVHRALEKTSRLSSGDRYRSDVSRLSKGSCFRFHNYEAALCSLLVLGFKPSHENHIDRSHSDR